MFENYLKRMLGLETGEEIFAIIHHHWLTFLGIIIKILLLPIALFFGIIFFGTDFLYLVLDSGLFSLILLAVLIVWATYSFYHWYIWYFDAIVLTNQRVALIEQKRLFDKTITGAAYEKIQDITVSQKGIAENVFNFGSIKIQTAGEAANLVLSGLKNPQNIARQIMNIKDKSTENQEDKNQS